MTASAVQRLLFALSPAVILVTVVVSTVWGDYGLVQRHRLNARLAEANRELASVERENQRLVRDLAVMEQDPLVLERLVAEELGWGADDAVLYRFEDAE